MPAAVVIAGIGLAVSVGSTALSVAAGNKQRKAQARASRYQKQIDNIRSARERVQAVRQARLASGALVQGAENQGAGYSSAALGGLGSIGSQLNSNLSFLDTTNALSDQAGVQLGKAAKYGQQASNISAIGSTISSAMFTASSMFGPSSSGSVEPTTDTSYDSTVTGLNNSNAATFGSGY